MLKEKSKAPAFEAQDQNGTMHRLADYAGRWVLLYFYPKDDTPGCTTEACGIRDVWNDFEKNGLVVLGVSTDSVKSHLKFAQKYHLPFPLLADENKDIVHAYGVWGSKKFMGREFLGTKRTSFLIDPDGNIARIYEQVKPAQHAEQILSDLAHLTKT